MPPDVLTPLLDLKALRVHLGDAGAPDTLAIDHLAIAAGAMLGVGGPSGSGKTTLLNVVAGLISPNSGSILWQGEEIGRLAEGARDRWRRRHVGFVFQDFHLIPELSVVDNILLPTQFAAKDAATPRRAEAAAAARGLGLARPDQRAAALSRGEQQRVAVARALILKPALLIADEPTASLDADNAGRVGEALVDGARRIGAALLCVSHDPVLLGRMDRCIQLRAGQIVPEGQA